MTRSGAPQLENLNRLSPPQPSPKGTPMDDQARNLPEKAGGSTPSSQALRERVDHRQWIGGAIATLLSFYWRSEDDPRVSEAAGKAWADDLEYFPREVICSVLNSWRRTATRRPTPADIIQLCRARMPRPTIVAPSPHRVRAPEERVATQAILDEFLGTRRFP